MIEENENIGFELNDECRKITAMLDADEMPELHHYLDSISDDENGITDDPYVIANEILKCDVKLPLPGFVREWVIELFQAAFDAGNADAMNDLGAQYYDGSRGFEQDFAKSVEYYKLAALNGSRQAQENLGYCYFYGRNMPPDYEKAFHYFALGAFDGHLISLYKIGDMYAGGYYVEKNPTEAFHIYSRCLDTMTDEAAPTAAGPVFLRMAKCFLYGIGTEKDAKAALICYQKAESYLYDMVRDGNYMYKKSLQAAIDGQAKARAVLAEELTGRDWSFDK